MDGWNKEEIRQLQLPDPHPMTFRSWKVDAGTIQQQLAGDMEVDQQSKEEKQNRSWLSKLFRR